MQGILGLKMDLNNVDKIKWEYLGRITRVGNVFGKERNIRVCPVCNGLGLLVYRNKGRFKQVCPECNYERISKDLDYLHKDKSYKLIKYLELNCGSNKTTRK